MGFRDWFDNLTRPQSARPEEWELDLLRAVLRPDAARSRRTLFGQVAGNSQLKRVIEADNYALRLESTAEPLADVHKSIRTPWFPVMHAGSLEELEMRVSVHRGGFFGALEGRSRVGTWPLAATPKPVPDTPTLDLPEPDPQALQRVADWLGHPESLLRAADVTATYPASTHDRERLAVADPALPAGYLDFLAVSDGMEVGPVEVLGARDAYTVDVMGRAHWLLGALPDAVFVLAAPGSEEIVTLPHDAEEPSDVDPSLRDFVRRWVAASAD